MQLYCIISLLTQQLRLLEYLRASPEYSTRYQYHLKYTQIKSMLELWLRFEYWLSRKLSRHKLQKFYSRQCHLTNFLFQLTSFKLVAWYFTRHCTIKHYQSYLNKLQPTNLYQLDEMPLGRASNSQCLNLWLSN